MNGAPSMKIVPSLLHSNRCLILRTNELPKAKLVLLSSLAASTFTIFINIIMMILLSTSPARGWRSSNTVHILKPKVQRPSPLLPTLALFQSTEATTTSPTLQPDLPSTKGRRPSRILSGVQPTGSLHLGNYLGAIQQWVKLQETAETYFCVVDLHAITVQPHDPGALREATLRSAALYLAAGIDPNKSKIFVQSHVSAHSELAWLLQCVTPVGWLERMIQYKEKSAKSASVGTGLLTYPVLMASDILLYQADLVPVGEDQRQHLELARDICRRTHDMFCSDNAYKKRMKAAGFPSYPIFTEPNALIVKDTARIMSLTDGTAKMSKSDPSDASRINLLDTPDVIAKKIKSAKTDSVSGIFVRDDRPEANNLIGIYLALHPSHVNKEELLDSLSGLTWGTFKPKLTEAIVSHLEPLQRRYEEVRSDQDETLWHVLTDGAASARAVAEPTLERTRAALGFLAAPPRL